MNKTRSLLLAFLAALCVACGGSGDSTPGNTWKVLQGELTDGDVLILDNQFADPYNFFADQDGVAEVRLNTSDFRGILRFYDADGTLLAQSQAAGMNAVVRQSVTIGAVYSVVVAGASAGEAGTYEIQYSPVLRFSSQVK